MSDVGATPKRQQEPVRLRKGLILNFGKPGSKHPADLWKVTAKRLNGKITLQNMETGRKRTVHLYQLAKKEQ
jgi:hypothetical protein